MPPASPRGLTLLHVLSWLNYGGVESYALRLSRALTARGHRVLVASGGGQLEPEFAAAGIEHFRLDFTGGRGFSGARALRRLLEREQVDLVNAHNWRAGMVSHLATRAAGVPYLLTIHGTRRAWSRHGVFYWSPKVAVVSEASRRNLVDGFGLAEDRVLNTIIGVDCDRFRPGPPEAELEVELGLQPGARRLLHVSRFSRRKAPVAQTLIEAAALLGRDVPDLEVVLVGQGPEEGVVRQAAEAVNARLGRRAVVALGGRGDIARLLNLSTAVVATASVALEAMAAGKPVLAAGKGGYLGPVTDATLARAEETCFGDHQVMDPLDPARMAEELRPWLADPEEAARAGRHSREIAVARYGMEQLADSAESMYRKVLCERDRVLRISVFHLNQIGDLVFTLPALKALREGFPEAHITSVMRPYLNGLVAHSGYVDEIVHRPRGGPKGAIPLGLRLRRQRPDLAVALSQSATMALCAWLSGAAQRIGYLDSDLCRFLSQRVQERGIPCPSKVLHLIRCLGLQPAQESYVGLLRISDADRARGEKLLAECGLTGEGPLVAMAPGESTDTPYKSWHAEGFAGVASRLATELGARLLVVGGEKDRTLGEQVLFGLGPQGANLAGRTTPAELAAVLARCALLIGIDSGPMHVAAAMGVPVVGLFGPTDPGRTGPQGEGHQIVFHQQDCWPCMTPTCQGRPCLAAITVEEVLAAARRGLGLGDG